MKFLPKLNRSSSNSQSLVAPPRRPTFGTARSEKMNQRLQQATTDRQKIKRAEYAATASNTAPTSLQQVLKNRGELIERRITRLQKQDQ